jgi:ATP-dependent DNA helicase RecG
MLIAKGPDEELRPLNVGLLFFTQKPEQYFSRCWIEVVVHKDFSGKGFTETYFKGAHPSAIEGCFTLYSYLSLQIRIIQVSTNISNQKYHAVCHKYLLNL